ncbi:MAG: bifunctional metallophosphatase/5'-nucleotidase [Planctomycetota bacterium]
MRLLLGIAALLPATTGRCQAPEKIPPDLEILHINDYHGQALPYGGPEGPGGIAVLASFVRKVRAESRAAEIWITDAGDWFQGTPEGNETQGVLPVRLMNRLGLSLAVLGNHEFDFGADNVRRLLALTRYPVLAANLCVAGTKTPVAWVRPYQIRAVKGIRIGILGVMTANTKAVSTGPFGDCQFGDEAEWIGRSLPRLRAESDAIVLLSHCGLARDRELARRFGEIRLILGGHSHSSLKAPIRVGRTWIVQTGGKSREVYRVQLAVHRASRSLELIRAEKLPMEPELYPPDPGFEAFLRRESAAIRARWDAPIGELSRDLGRPRSFGSTPAGNLVADLIRAEGEARIGIQNKGGLRRQIPKGPLTLRTVFELLPFENWVVSMDLSGKELVKVLEQGLSGFGPLEVSGIEYQVIVGPSGRSIGTVRLSGKGGPILEDAVYRVATNSFLARGGDGILAFRAGRNRRDHRKLLRELLTERIRQVRRLTAPGDARISIVHTEK